MKPKPGALVPAAARAGQSTALDETESQLSQAAIRTFETAIGGRDKFAEVLAIADDAPEIAKIIDLLLDPRYENYSLRRLCTITGLTVADFFAAYKKAAIVRAHIQTAPIIAAKLVGVVDDLMTRAQPHYVECPVCRGVGTVTPDPTTKLPTPEPVRCKACRDGKQLVFPDLDRQKLALEVAELIKPRAGVTFNQAILPGSNGGGAVPGGLEQLQQAASAVLFSRVAPTAPPTPTEAPIEGSVVEEPSTS